MSHCQAFQPVVNDGIFMIKTFDTCTMRRDPGYQPVLYHWATTTGQSSALTILLCSVQVVLNSVSHSCGRISPLSKGSVLCIEDCGGCWLSKPYNNHGDCKSLMINLIFSTYKCSHHNYQPSLVPRLPFNSQRWKESLWTRQSLTWLFTYHSLRTRPSHVGPVLGLHVPLLRW